MCSIFYVTSDTKVEEKADETAISSSGIAIYIDSGSGYELSSSSEFPTSSQYTLNTTYSKCTNGGTITQDSETKAISVSVSSSDYCTLYYDYQSLQKLSDYVISLADTETTPDFSETATDDEGVLAMEDDYGTSYYYRGTVTNNYVYFAGYYWRIIRINGNGTIRMIYDGTTAHENGESSTDRYISTSAYNAGYNYNAYVGYMYGALGSSSYSQEHANTNDSTVKTVLDEWYEDNLKGTSYESYLADSIFCNDRSLYSGNGYSTTSNTSYSAYNRISVEHSPELVCSQQNDAFTVSDITYGNGDLTYPIGLITADEVAIAGGAYSDGYDSYNSYYLYTGSEFWTMTPGRYESESSYAWNMSVSYAGHLSTGLTGATSTGSWVYGVRPVINLAADVVFSSGDGTINSPYIIEIEKQTLSDYVISLADTTTTPTFSSTATTDEGVLAMEDDYGTSYYFRGAVENNYVYFAGYYWRIVRVNGDGTVRLIYDGSSSAYANGTSSTDRYISTSSYHSTYYQSPAYVGYMYGDITDTKSSSTGSISMSSSSSYYYGSSYTYDASTGYYTLSGSTTSGIWSSIYSSVISTYKYTCKSTSSTGKCSALYEITAYSSDTYATGYTHILSGSSYEDVTENVNDSTIKGVLDTWYKNNLLDTEYESYLADEIFCNDRSVYSGDGYSLSATTYYSAYNRLYTNKSPQLTCNQQNDAFTVDDTTYGNGDLTYPIGLITADEVALAGGVYGTANSSYYLYIGNYFWTMSPSYFGVDYLYAYVWYVGSTGDLYNLAWVTNSNGVRPVLNLSSDVLIKEGDGSQSRPFEVTL